MKLQDPWEDGWMVLKPPNEKFPSTAVIEKGFVKMAVNLAYIQPDTRLEVEQDMTEPMVKENDSWFGLSQDEAEWITATCDVVDSDDEQGPRFYLNGDEEVDDRHVTLRRSKRVRKKVKRLTFGLTNTTSYDCK